MIGKIFLKNLRPLLKLLIHDDEAALENLTSEKSLYLYRSSN